MRAFAKKQTLTKEAEAAGSARPGRALSGQDHEASYISRFRRPLQTNAQEPIDGSFTSALTRSHNFSRIPVHAQTPSGIQGKSTDALMGLDARFSRGETVGAWVPGAGGTLSSHWSIGNRVTPATIQKRQLAGQLSSVVEDPARIQQAAKVGISGPSEPLPFINLIQQSFGRHDVSQVRAHLDSAAADGTAAMGAAAFTVGDHVAFAGRPSLPLAAHEATHVLQQRAGVQLSGGVGQTGDEHEQHADAVAARVAAGLSSEDLLGTYVGEARASMHQSRHARTPSGLIQLQSVPRSLTNPLFAGDAMLQSVLDGKTTLSSGQGKHIYKVQVALMNLGYSLPIFGADSSFGKEMAVALGQFQNDNGITVTESLDAATMAMLDQKAPATPLTKYPEYAELLGDGLLDFTVAVGYDEDGSFDPEIDAKPGEKAAPGAIIPGLKTRGFDEKAAADAEKVYAKAGIKMPSTAGGRYFIKPAMLTYKGKNIDVIVRLITYKDPDARKAFLEAMQKSDVSFYTGHGRYGSGPDFDPKTKGTGNILINPSPTVKDSGTAHMYEELKKQGVKQPLPDMSFDQKYKIWFFDGCNTKHYMKSIRKLAKVDTKKTDVFGWGSEIDIDTTGEDVLSFVDGLIAMQSAQKLIEDLNKINKIDKSTPTAGVEGEGLGDNPNAK